MHPVETLCLIMVKPGWWGMSSWGDRVMPGEARFWLSAPDHFRNSASVFEFDEQGRLYRASKQLFAEGDSAFYGYKMVRGVVICFKSLADGRRSIDAFRLAGDVFGFDSDGERQFSAAAISDVSVKVARRNAIFLRAAAGPDAVRGLLASTHEEIRRVQRRGMLLAMNARQRVASFLLEMSERLDQPHILKLPMCRRDIADDLGL
jgi:CRP/FNR family nitrogen fixation transcriptional regulator